MLRVGIEDVRPGMTLAVAVCHPKRPGTTLLSAGVTLERRSIRRLRELPIGAMWIEHPAFADLDEQIRPEVLRAQREAVHHGAQPYGHRVRAQEPDPGRGHDREHQLPLESSERTRHPT